MKVRVADKEDMNEVYALRIEVFVEEQNVPIELEMDDEDDVAVHFIADEEGHTVGCGRVIFCDRGARIGRLAVKKGFRGRGVGKELCEYILRYCEERGAKFIRLNSQLHAVGFYERIGFVRVGDIFLDAGIEHVEMYFGGKCSI